jgi:hypothetical protein
MAMRFRQFLSAVLILNTLALSAAAQAPTPATAFDANMSALSPN